MPTSKAKTETEHTSRELKNHCGCGWAQASDETAQRAQSAPSDECRHEHTPDVAVGTGCCGGSASRK